MNDKSAGGRREYRECGKTFGQSVYILQAALVQTLQLDFWGKGMGGKRKNKRWKDTVNGWRQRKERVHPLLSGKGRGKVDNVVWSQRLSLETHQRLVSVSTKNNNV